MHFLVSNPDTIGDLVLRQPLLRALLDAGHQLTLIVRATVEPAVALVAPEARTIVLPREVYGGVTDNWPAFTGVVDAAKAAKPDVLLIAAYQWTEFEERLAAELREAQPNLVVAGMNGRLYSGDPFAGRAPVSSMKMDRVAEVDVDQHESEKNAALAAMLGAPVKSVDPVLSPAQSAIDAANQVLQERGLAAGGFYLACVTGTANVPIKAWPAERWAAVLRNWHERFGRRFLFIGLPQERSVVEQVQAAMGEAASATAIWMEPGSSLETLTALASLSQGYVGHDTGPMHIAAAVGKPVIAVFGGGHKLRFTPRVSPSVALAVRVPCAGCGWACSFDKAHCVHALTVDQVLAAVDDFENGRVVDREARLHPLSPELADHMLGFAADLARQRARDAADLTQQLEQRGQDLATLSRQAGESEAAMKSLSEECSGLVEQLKDREAAVVELREEVERVRTAATEQHRRETQALNQQVETLQRRVAELETQASDRHAKRWRARLVDLVVGSRHYAAPVGLPPLPSFTLATPISVHDDDATIRRTMESVLAENYPGLRYVLVTDDPSRAVLQEYRDRGVSIEPANGQSFRAIGDVFGASDADLIAWLPVGQAYEPGGLTRIGEYFRDHRRAMAASFEQTIETEGGWRFPDPRPRLEVGTLRDPANPWLGVHVVFRRTPYQLLGPLNPEKKSAAGWDLLVRFARRYGIRRGRGHSVCQFGPPSQADIDVRELAVARATFEATFPTAGRMRTRTLALANRAGDRIWRMARPANRRDWAWPTVRVPAGTHLAAGSESQPPISPITQRPPDRLLFSAIDPTTGDPAVHRVYYDSVGDVALAYPPVGGGTLERLYAEQGKLSGSAVVPPADPGRSPYRQFRAGPLWVRWLTTLPAFYWRLARRRPGEESLGKRMIRLLGAVRLHDSNLRALVVGAFDGALLDELKTLTSWQISGIETNESAVLAARGRGHRIWACSPQDAFMTLPDGEVFDLLIIPSMLEHWTDPAWVLRRLIRLLKPQGRILIRTPNLDSRLLELFGPTWWHWQLPYHRTLLGRSGLRTLARSTELRVTKLRTVTDAYVASASVQLNKLGLAAKVPLGAEFPEDVAARGSRLAGWGRVLWDRWGRGDEMWAVLEMV